MQDLPFFRELNDLETIAVAAIRDYLNNSHWDKMYASTLSVEENSFFGESYLEISGIQRTENGIKYINTNRQ